MKFTTKCSVLFTLLRLVLIDEVHLKLSLTAGKLLISWGL